MIVNWAQVLARSVTVGPFALFTYPPLELRRSTLRSTFTVAGDNTQMLAV